MILPTDAKMLMTYAECLKRQGSDYRLKKAIADGVVFKLGEGIYSDVGDESELEIIQWKHPNAVMTLDSAYFYYGLTDTIPEYYYMATASNARAILDSRVRQFYMPRGTYSIGLTEIDYQGEKVRAYDLERLVIETARMKPKLAPDMYREVVLAFRAKASTIDLTRLQIYLRNFAKRDLMERIICEEVL